MRELTEMEQKTYDFIIEVGEVQTTNLPDRRMLGTIPSLKNMGWLKFLRNIPVFLEVKRRSLLE